MSTRIRPIRTEEDYNEALALCDTLLEADPKPGSAAADQLDVLLALIEHYEWKHHRIMPPDPIEFLKEAMTLKGLKPKDLEPCIGSKGRVSEVLHRKRKLTLRMVHALSNRFDLPAEVLIQPYDRVDGPEDQKQSRA